MKLVTWLADNCYTFTYEAHNMRLENEHYTIVLNNYGDIYASIESFYENKHGEQILDTIPRYLFEQKENCDYVVNFINLKKILKFYDFYSEN